MSNISLTEKHVEYLVVYLDEDGREFAEGVPYISRDNIQDIEEARKEKDRLNKMGLTAEIWKREIEISSVE